MSDTPYSYNFDGVYRGLGNDKLSSNKAICDELNKLRHERDENKAGWDSCSLTALRLEQERNRAVRCLQAIQEYLAAAQTNGITLGEINKLIDEWKVSTK